MESLRALLAASEERASELDRARVVAEERAIELSLDLERARVQAKGATSQSERLVEGLRLITEARNVEELYAGLLDLLKDVLEFEHAFILVAEAGAQTGPTDNNKNNNNNNDNPVQLVVVATSSSAYEATHWQAAKCFKSVLTGKTRAAFDTSKLPEWKHLPQELLERSRAAMHVPIRTGNGGAILVCVHSQRGFFTKSRVRLGGRFSALARNALRNAELLEAQRRRLDELSTPMIPISASVVIMPIIGGMDEARGEKLLEAALQGVHERSVEHVIVDITALRELDRHGARALVKIAGALRLLGCQTLLSGIQPRVAVTLVALEGLDGIHVCGTLQSAVAQALS